MKTARELQAAADREARRRVAEEEAAEAAAATSRRPFLPPPPVVRKRRTTPGRPPILKRETPDPPEADGSCYCGAPKNIVPSVKFYQRHSGGFGQWSPSPPCRRAKACKAEYNRDRRAAARQRREEELRIRNRVFLARYGCGLIRNL